ncbi:MAG: ATP-binding protein [Bacteroidota bacterium]
MDNTHVVFNIDNNLGYFSLLKKEIHWMAAGAGFTGGRLGEVDIVVSEMASNLMKHSGKGGEILVRALSDPKPGIELICIDSGRGMTDVLQFQKDGFSTTKTLGQGLGAITRLCNFSEIYSMPDWGTIVLGRMYCEEDTMYIAPPKMTVGWVKVSKPGEKVCGDGVWIEENKNHFSMLVADGLGHGEHARNAVIAAETTFSLSKSHLPNDMIRDLHAGIKKTRGIVGTVLILDKTLRKWMLCGVGNIATRLLFPTGSKACISYNGIIGLNIPKTMNNQELPLENNQLFILCSDGIKTRWDLAKYPGIQKYDATMIAAVLYKDHARMTDDMLSVVVKTSMMNV